MAREASKWGIHPMRTVVGNQWSVNEEAGMLGEKRLSSGAGLWHLSGMAKREQKCGGGGGGKAGGGGA